MEESISCEDDLSRIVLHEPADTVLSMARSVDCLDSNITYLEAFAVLGCLRNSLTVLAANDWLSFELRVCKLPSRKSTRVYVIGAQIAYQFIVATCMVPVAVICQ